MIYVKVSTRAVLILLCSSIGIIPSSLQAAAHRIIDYQSFTDGLKANDAGYIKYLINQHERKNVKGPKYKYDKLLNGKSPLHEAASYLNNPNNDSIQYVDGIRTFLNAIPNPQAMVTQKSQEPSRDRESTFDATPLQIVSGYKYELDKPLERRNVVAEVLAEPKERGFSNSASKFVDLLINQSANVDARDNNGLTPLHWAVRHKNLLLVQALLNAGADANIIDNYNKLPLHWAAIGGYTPIIQLLLAKTKPDLINQKDRRGRTPLLWVQRSRQGATAYEGGAKHMSKEKALENIRLLVKAGANPAIKDEEGHDAIYWAQHTHQTNDPNSPLVVNQEELALLQQKAAGYPQQQPPMQPQQVAAQIARTQAPQPTPPPFVSQQPRCNHRSQHSLVNNRYNRNLRNKQPDSNRLMRTKH